jgi:hypothetical protein
LTILKKNKPSSRNRGRTMLEKPRKTENLSGLTGFFSPM